MDDREREQRDTTWRCDLADYLIRLASAPGDLSWRPSPFLYKLAHWDWFWRQRDFFFPVVVDQFLGKLTEAERETHLKRGCVLCRNVHPSLCDCHLVMAELENSNHDYDRWDSKFSRCVQVTPRDRFDEAERNEGEWVEVRTPDGERLALRLGVELWKEWDELNRRRSSPWIDFQRRWIACDGSDSAREALLAEWAAKPFNASTWRTDLIRDTGSRENVGAYTFDRHAHRMLQHARAPKPGPEIRCR